VLPPPANLEAVERERARDKLECPMSDNANKSATVDVKIILRNVEMPALRTSLLVKAGKIPAATNKLKTTL
jgi:hypothetical protein